MSSEVSLYELVYEYWKIENSTRELAKLPEGFEDKLREYFSKTRGYLRVADKKMLSTSLKEAEIDSIAKIIQSLFEIRLGKILRALESGTYPENMYGFEKNTYISLHRILNDHKKHVESIMMAAAYNRWKIIESNYDVVCFQQDFPQIVGEDLRTYGPFKMGDIAVLPKSNAQTLIVKGIAYKLIIMTPEIEGE
ncbi:MAG: hypothetical protein ABDH32_00400 [Candidatus Caldarchaeales archaeon]